VLHALHELVETRIFGACLFAPHKVVSWDVLSTPYPEWVRDNFLVVKTPSDVPEFHHVTAVQYPRDEQMDIRAADRAVKVDDRLFFSRNPRPLNHHSPASGAAAGLNLESCVQRAIAEVLQGTGGELGGRRRKAVPVGIPVAEPEDVVNYETDSVTGDIRLILKLLGEEVFVGIVDVADPDLQIPVIKLISDYEPRYSLVSQRVLNRFFEGKEV
jgi:hypothetical protein